MRPLNPRQMTLIRERALLTHMASWDREVGGVNELFEDISTLGPMYVGKVWDRYGCKPRNSSPIDFMTIGLMINHTADALEELVLSVQAEK